MKFVIRSGQIIASQASCTDRAACAAHARAMQSDLHGVRRHLQRLRRLGQALRDRAAAAPAIGVRQHVDGVAHDMPSSRSRMSPRSRSTVQAAADARPRGSLGEYSSMSSDAAAAQAHRARVDDDAMQPRRELRVRGERADGAEGVDEHVATRPPRNASRRAARSSTAMYFRTGVSNAAASPPH